MESKISIDVDTSGVSQIRIDYRLTDDLRDKLIGRFLKRMGIPGEKNGFWAYCRLGHENQSQPNGYWDGAVVFIEPLNEHTLGLHVPEILFASGERPQPTQSSEPEFKEGDPIFFGLIDRSNGIATEIKGRITGCRPLGGLHLYDLILYTSEQPGMPGMAISNVPTRLISARNVEVCPD